VAAPGRGMQTWFLLPWKGRLLAGTAYVPPVPGATGEVDLAAGPGEEHVATFLAALDAALPGLGLAGERVSRVFSGWLSAAADGMALPTLHSIVHDHAASGGPRGLLSVSGVKLTTARALAEQTLARVFALRGEPVPPPGWIERPPPDPPLPVDDLLRLAGRDREGARAHLRGLVERQAVMRLDDLLLRRTDWGLQPEAEVAARLCATLGWADLRPRGCAGAEPLAANGGR